MKSMFEATGGAFWLLIAVAFLGSGVLVVRLDAGAAANLLRKGFVEVLGGDSGKVYSCDPQSGVCANRN